MTKALWIPLALVACGKSGPPVAPETEPEDAAKVFVDRVNADLVGLYRESARAAWKYATDITDENAAAATASDEKVMAYAAKAVAEAVTYDPSQTDPETARGLLLLKTDSDLPAPHNAEGRSELAGLANKLQGMYGKGKWCRSEGDCLPLGDISEIIGSSRDPAELEAAWTGWRTISQPMRPDYQRFAELINQGASDMGFDDAGELWRARYDMSPEEIRSEVNRLWEDVKPLYEQLHCLVRSELSETYGESIVPTDGPIPAHLLGNMWAQDWVNIYDIVEPFEGQPSLDVTSALVDQKWDHIKMTKTAEAFFTSMGLDPMPQTFWERSMFVKPDDREVVCHASAWDVDRNDDQRIKMCIRPNMDDLITLHHELGHNYYNHYNHGMPELFRGAAHDGFHEAIGDAIALSATPGYLKQIGLVDDVSTSQEAVINQQMSVALSKIAFLPFGLMVDSWRWGVFDGSIAPDAYNKGWWDLRLKYQGIAPPSERTEDHFDPGAKYHIPGNTPYLRYFLSHIVQFQLHKAMCDAAGFDGPLHECSVYGSTEAGDALIGLLKLGSSKPWPDAMEAMTGGRTMEADALVAYFQPLHAWLTEQNQGRTCGW